MCLQVRDDFAGFFVGDVGAEGFVHFIDLGFPGRGGQRRLHRDVSGRVASVAVDANLLKAVAWREVESWNWVGRNCKVCVRFEVLRSGLLKTAELRRRVFAFLQIGESEHGDGCRGESDHQKLPSFRGCRHELTHFTDDVLLSFDPIPEVAARIPGRLIGLDVVLVVGGSNSE